MEEEERSPLWDTSSGGENIILVSTHNGTVSCRQTTICAGSPDVVIIAGVPGCGKTSVAEAIQENPRVAAVVDNTNPRADRGFYINYAIRNNFGVILLEPVWKMNSNRSAIRRNRLRGDLGVSNRVMRRMLKKQYDFSPDEINDEPLPRIVGVKRFPEFNKICSANHLFTTFYKKNMLHSAHLFCKQKFVALLTKE